MVRTSSESNFLARRRRASDRVQNRSMNRRYLVEALEDRVLLTASNPASVPASHIIVFHDGVDVNSVAAELSTTRGLDITNVYQHALTGIAAVVPAGQLATLQDDPRVDYVEANQRVELLSHTGVSTPTGVHRIFAPDNSNLTIDGIDDLRIDVDVAVLDTGLDEDHPALNIAGGWNCATGGPFNQSCDVGGFNDGNGHGTHVGGTIGGLDGSGAVGVAPGARLWAVRVLNNQGSGYMNWIVAGIDTVTANADTIEVANMSLGCECSSAAMDDAITNSVAAGVVYAVAAGNSSQDASTFSPANHPDVITVSALADFDGIAGGETDQSVSFSSCTEDDDDTSACFSNFGNLIDIAAPGVLIHSAWNDGGYNTISGTSMASPHVAGAAALLKASGLADDSPANIRSTLLAEGNFNWTDESGDGILEPLLDVGNEATFTPATVAGDAALGGEDPPPNDPDIVAGTISLSPTTIGSGELVSIDFNYDVVDASTDPYDISFYLSSDTTLDGGDTLLGAAEPGQTAVGSYLLSTSRTIDAADGTWYIIGQVDSGAAITESNEGNNESNSSLTVSSSPAPEGSNIHVGDLDGAYNVKGKSGKTEFFVTVLVHDDTHNSVANVTVDGTWSDDAASLGSVSAITGDDGTVTFSTGNLTGATSVTFTVDTLAGTLPYDATDNHETTITIDVAAGSNVSEQDALLLAAGDGGEAISVDASTSSETGDVVDVVDATVRELTQEDALLAATSNVGSIGTEPLVEDDEEEQNTTTGDPFALPELIDQLLASLA